MKSYLVILFFLVFGGLLGMILKVGGDNLWAYITTITTIFLWIVAYFELEEFNKTTKADFIKRFNTEFFSGRTRELVMLFDCNALDFQLSNIDYKESGPAKVFQYFTVNEEIVKQLPLAKKDKEAILDKKSYSDFEIDDGLLGYIENIGYFEKKGLIDITDVYTSFGWYINVIWNNKEIKKYLEAERKTEKDGDDIYEDFNYIFKKCNSYGKASLGKKYIWWWKIKWFFSNTIFYKKYYSVRFD